MSASSGRFLWISVLISVFGVAFGVPVSFSVYMAPGGSDLANGTQPSMPVATLQRAFDIAQHISRGQRGNETMLNVYLEGGEYPGNQTLATITVETHMRITAQSTRAALHCSFAAGQGLMILEGNGQAATPGDALEVVVSGLDVTGCQSVASAWGGVRLVVRDGTFVDVPKPVVFNDPWANHVVVVDFPMVYALVVENVDVSAPDFRVSLPLLTLCGHSSLMRNVSIHDMRMVLPAIDIRGNGVHTLSNITIVRVEATPVMSIQSVVVLEDVLVDDCHSSRDLLSVNAYVTVPLNRNGEAAFNSMEVTRLDVLHCTATNMLAIQVLSPATRGLARGTVSFEMLGGRFLGNKAIGGSVIQITDAKANFRDVYFNNTIFKGDSTSTAIQNRPKFGTIVRHNAEVHQDAFSVTFSSCTFGELAIEPYLRSATAMILTDDSAHSKNL